MPEGAAAGERWVRGRCFGVSVVAVVDVSAGGSGCGSEVGDVFGVEAEGSFFVGVGASHCHCYWVDGDVHH